MSTNVPPDQNGALYISSSFFLIDHRTKDKRFLMRVNIGEKRLTLQYRYNNSSYNNMNAMNLAEILHAGCTGRQRTDRSYAKKIGSLTEASGRKSGQLWYRVIRVWTTIVNNFRRRSRRRFNCGRGNRRSHLKILWVIDRWMATNYIQTLLPMAWALPPTKRNSSGTGVWVCRNECFYAWKE